MSSCMPLPSSVLASCHSATLRLSQNMADQLLKTRSQVCDPSWDEKRTSVKGVSRRSLFQSIARHERLNVPVYYSGISENTPPGVNMHAIPSPISRGRYGTRVACVAAWCASNCSQDSIGRHEKSATITALVPLDPLYERRQIKCPDSIGRFLARFHTPHKDWTGAPTVGDASKGFHALFGKGILS